MQVVQSWQDLWVLVGEVEATLSGLLFVAVSFNLRTIMSKAHPHLRTSAFRTFSQFVLLIEIAIAFQIRRKNPERWESRSFCSPPSRSRPTTTRRKGSGSHSRARTSSSDTDHSSRSPLPDSSSCWDSVGFYLLLMLAFFILISAVTSAWQLLIDVGGTNHRQ